MIPTTEHSSSVFFGVTIALVTSLCLNVLLFLQGISFKSKASLSSQSSSIETVNSSSSTWNVVSGWWTDPARFELEQRAIFSRSWICISHLGRFGKPGDYVTYRVATFSIILILGKDNVVRAFHNVCRHRAFPVATKTSGSSVVLRCQYHAWTYDATGRLIKAPQFDGLEGFDKSQNGLYEIKTHVDDHGFIHMSFSGFEGEDKTPPSIDGLMGINKNSKLLHSCDYKGSFNWKFAVQEDHSVWQQKIAAIPKTGFFRTTPQRQTTPIEQHNFFPLTKVYKDSTTGVWYQLTYSPDSAEQTSVRCEVYSLTDRPRDVQLVDCMKANFEKHLQFRILDHEQMHSKFANTTSSPDLQPEIVEMMKKHLEKEKLHGTQIHPAAVKRCSSSAFSRAEGLYQKMSCSGPDISW